MKRFLLALTILCASFIVGYAQDKESLGDKAMASGNYAEAVERYNEAILENSTVSLLDKYNKASLLKAEFDAIDAAIFHHDSDEFELHVQNVLMIDPNNRFVDWSLY